MSFVEIKFPNGCNRKLNLNDLYENKVKTVTEIIDSWGNYFSQNWDKTLIIGGRPIKPVPKILDSLGYYLMYKSEKQLTKQGIQNRYKTVSAYKEIPVSCCAINIQDLFFSLNEDEDFTYDGSVNGNTKEYGEIDKRYKCFKHLRKISPLFIEHIRIDKEISNVIKLAQIESDLYLIVLEKFYQEEFAKDVCKELMWHYQKLKYNLGFKDFTIREKNRLLYFAKKSFMNTLTQFEKIDLFTKNNLNLSKPFYYKWAIVDSNNEFTVKDKKYAVNLDYEFDKILCYKQDNNIYFLTPQIELITKYIKEI